MVDSSSQHPTEEGRKRYPDTKGYYPDLSAREDDVPDYEAPCLCTSRCERRCAGECGCPACALSFSVFCDDIPALIRPDNTLDTDAALRAYRYGEYPWLHEEDAGTSPGQ